MTGAVPPAPPGDDRDTAAELVGGFPRHATRDLVEEGERRRRARLPLAAALLALGATLLALGSPSERLHGPGPALVDALAVGGLADLRALYLPLAQLVDALPRLTAERTAYLLSGLAFGALAWVVWRMGAAREASPHARVIAALLALASPAAWIAGRHPGPEMPAAACGAACFAVLARAGRGRGRTVAAGALWLSAASLSPAWVWTLPAVAAGAARGASWWRAAIAWIALVVLGALAWLVGIAGVHWIDGAAPWAYRDAGLDALRALSDADAGPAPARLGVALAAVGASWVGALGLLARDEHGGGVGGADGAPNASGRAPAWVLAWLASAVVAALCVPLDVALPAMLALPPLALGAYRLLGARPAWTGRAATLSLVVAALAAAAGASAWWSAGDPDAAWRAVLQREARRGDVLLTTSWDRRYLAQRRYGLRAIDVGGVARLSPGYRAEERVILERRLARVAATGARLVLDERVGTADPELAALVAGLRERLAIDALPYPAAP